MALTNKIYKDYCKKPKPLKLTKQEREKCNKAEICHICNEEFYEGDSTAKMLKVRDQCHFTGNVSWCSTLATLNCRLRCRKPMLLLVICHNLQGYDSHLFIKQLAKVTGQLSCIPSTEEKYVSFSKKIKVDEYKSRRTGATVSLHYEIRFIDSFKFLQTSLANLVSNPQPTDFKNTKSIIKSNISLLTQKGVYPYDYV